jgi:hypothetical protein
VTGRAWLVAMLLLAPSARAQDTVVVVRRDSVRVCAGGDITLGTDLDTSWVRRAKADPATPDSLVAAVRPIMSGADVILVNAEGAIGDGPIASPKCRPGKKHCFMLRQPLDAALAIRHLGDSGTVVVANLANNHAHDAGEAGFARTTAALTGAGVLVTGADTIPTVVATARGDTVAVFGFSAWSSPGVGDLDAVRRLVARAAARYRWVIVTMHLGAEGKYAQRTIDSVETYVGESRGNPVAFAHAAVDAGARLVLGHGPHVLRAAEWRDSALIVYSMGNLVNYGPFNLDEPNRRGAVFCATLDTTGRPRDVVIRATLQALPGRVSVDSAGRAWMLIDSLSRLDFPTTGVTVDSATGAVGERSAGANDSVGGTGGGNRGGGGGPGGGVGEIGRGDVGRVGVDHAAGAAPGFDAADDRAIEPAFDDAAGGARGLDEVSVADVDPDVGDLLADAEGDEVAGL